jgi:hypothetical protein
LYGHSDAAAPKANALRRNCHRLCHPIIRDWVAIGEIATFIVATKKEPQAEYVLGVLVD